MSKVKYYEHFIHQILYFLSWFNSLFQAVMPGKYPRTSEVSVCEEKNVLSRSLITLIYQGD